MTYTTRRTARLAVSVVLGLSLYRVKVAGDGDHVNGYGRLRTLTVH